MNIYQEEILDHYHNPRNFGVLDKPTHETCANNPTCGDTISVTMLIKNDIITDIKFTGSGCAISQAATSLTTEKILHKSTTDALSLTKDDIITLLGVDVGAGRIKCALLGIESIQKAIIYGKISEDEK